VIWTIVAILLFLLIPGVSWHAAGGLIPVVLGVSVVVLMFNLVTGRLIA
jgi:hypothetical protein